MYLKGTPHRLLFHHHKTQDGCSNIDLTRCCPQGSRNLPGKNHMTKSQMTLGICRASKSGNFPRLQLTKRVRICQVDMPYIRRDHRTQLLQHMCLPYRECTQIGLLQLHTYQKRKSSTPCHRLVPQNFLPGLTDTFHVRTACNLRGLSDPIWSNICLMGTEYKMM